MLIVNKKLNLSTLVLIIVNFYLIYLVLIGGINVEEILLIFCFETLIIFIFIFLKIMFAQKFLPPDTKHLGKDETAQKLFAENNVYKIKEYMLIRFFPSVGMMVFGYFFLLTKMFHYHVSITSLILPVLFIFFGHLISYIKSYILNEEYKLVSLNSTIYFVIARIFPFHVSFLFGAFIFSRFNHPVGMLLLLIIIKTVFDIAFQIAEHKQQNFNKNMIDLNQTPTTN